jgi:arylformamidase
MKKIHDITMGIHDGMLVYPGDPGVSVRRVNKIGINSSANISELCMGSHTGTHIDPPFHFNPEGKKADALPLDALIGEAAVVQAPGERIDRVFIEGSGVQGAARVLFKTKNSVLGLGPPFREDFSHLTPDAAACLVEMGVKLVGIDYLSVEKFHSADHAVHHLLLDNGVVILEGLDLSGVEPGRYELICLPLKITGGDGAPARAVLLEDLTG